MHQAKHANGLSLPYISEIHYRTPDASQEAEFVEIVLKPGENPADFTISFYDELGVLDTAINASDPASGSSANVIANGEVCLGDLVGLPDPDSPEYTIYLLSGTVQGNKLFNGATSSGVEANYVSLYDTNAGALIDAYGVVTNPDRVLSGGAADGETATSTTVGWVGAGESIQFDASGNQFKAARSSNDAVTCFDENTRILTPMGLRPLRDLNVGDPVITLDHGPQPIRWISVTHHSARALALAPKLKPVCVAPNALGSGFPARTLRISRQHRLLIASSHTEALFGATEILVPAIKLDSLAGIGLDLVPRPVTYRHILFDRHEVIFAEGLPTESLLLGPAAKTILPADWNCKTEAHRPADQNLRPARPIIERRSDLKPLLTNPSGTSPALLDAFQFPAEPVYSAASA